MRLFIAEKPELARAIVEGLGGGEKKNNYFQCGNDRVTWCIGHLLKLYDPVDYDDRYASWSLDLFPFFFYPVKYKAKTKTKDQLKTVLYLMKNATTVVHAGDPDQEGQLIVDELIEYADFEGTVLRFNTNDNEPEIIKKALSNLTDNTQYKPLYAAAQARQIADQLYGYNMTSVYTLLAREKGYQGTISIGRVQTPILALVVNRQKAFESHQKSSFYELNATLDSHILKLLTKDLLLVKDDKHRLLDKQQVDELLVVLSTKPKVVSAVSDEVKVENHPLCYNMLKLQIDASKTLGLKPDQVMKISQSLRETHQLISYNGTDSQYLNDEHHQHADTVIGAICANLSIDDSGFDRSIKSRVFNDAKVTAHHAIIPKDKRFDFSVLSQDEIGVYQLIANKYLQQFLPKYKYHDNRLEVTTGNHKFSISTRSVNEIGFKSIGSKGDELKGPVFDAYKEGDSVDVELSVQSKQTKPLPLYTYDTLLSELPRIAKYVKNEKLKKVLIEKDKDKPDEHGGIGTARTRDVILTSLIKRGLMKEKGKSLIATKTGIQLIEHLPDGITSPDMTALWHEQFKQIEAGKKPIEEFLQSVYGFCESHINSIDQLNMKFETHECPECGSYLRPAKSKKGKFWSCIKYPDCKFTAENKRNKPVIQNMNTPHTL